MKEYFAPDCWGYRDELGRKYPRVALLHGMFGYSKSIQVYDPKAMYDIFIKELDTYPEPVEYVKRPPGFPILERPSVQLLGPGLLGTLGPQHKKQRKMLNLVFSVKHLREMTPLFYDVIHKSRDAIIQRVRATGTKDGIEFDMLHWSARTTLEVLGHAGLGVSFDPLTEDRPDEFAMAVKEFLGWVVERTPIENIQQIRRISDTMHERSVQIFNDEKAALMSEDEAIKHQIGEGQNILASDDDKLPGNELAAQRLFRTMILAGMDTTANSLARVLQLLADRPKVQDKLREEILQAVESEGESDTLDFDKIMALPYLDAVCRETFRVTAKDVVLPLSEPIRLRDGTMFNAVHLPKGMEIIPDVGAANCDTTLWGPDAHEWRPERWLEPLPRALEEAHVPGVYSHANIITFSLTPIFIGNKACVGFKFAQVEFNGPSHLLQHFMFKPSRKKSFWNYAGVQYLTFGSTGASPGLPLIVYPVCP
ncbi:hypothetical protein V8D89_009194 [Ganoderma adspersum]